MLGRPGLFDCLMLSAQTRYIQRSAKTMILFCSLFIYVLLVELFYIFPRKSKSSIMFLGIQYKWIFLNLGVSAVCIIFYILASFTLPGYVENPIVDFQDFLEIIDST